MTVITAFDRSPDGGTGLARDTRVRWALEEVGQPCGPVPARRQRAARAITWMFAALNTVEPPILELVTAKFAEGDKPWAEERVPLVKDRIRVRLGQLSARLGDADWLDGPFSAGDLMSCRCCSGCDLRAFWTRFRSSPPMSPAGKRGPHTSGPSPPNWRSINVPDPYPGRRLPVWRREVSARPSPGRRPTSAAVDATKSRGARPAPRAPPARVSASRRRCRPCPGRCDRWRHRCCC